MKQIFGRASVQLRKLTNGPFSLDVQFVQGAEPTFSTWNRDHSADASFSDSAMWYVLLFSHPIGCCFTPSSTTVLPFRPKRNTDEGADQRGQRILLAVNSHAPMADRRSTSSVRSFPEMNRRRTKACHGFKASWTRVFKMVACQFLVYFISLSSLCLEVSISTHIRGVATTSKYILCPPWRSAHACAGFGNLGGVCFWWGPHYPVLCSIPITPMDSTQIVELL